MREQGAAQKRTGDAADAAKTQSPACAGRADARRIDQAGKRIDAALSADADPGAENERDQSSEGGSSNPIAKMHDAPAASVTVRTRSIPRRSIIWAMRAGDAMTPSEKTVVATIAADGPAPASCRMAGVHSSRK